MGVLGRVKQLVRIARQGANASTREVPLVSVVVPFYNVESYLGQSVDSILAQTLTSLEVILVDDGSTDGSARIAADIAARDSRVQVLTQANAGPGAARNVGVARASGAYLTFVDSDDRLPAGALDTLVRSAMTNDADIVVGAIRRFDSNRVWLPEWVKGVHSCPAQGIRLIELPGLLRNNYPVGKVFRRAFWNSHDLAFRRGVIYEDQPLIAQMYSRARSINVLTEITYDYRRREDRSSISQRPEEIADLRDRIAAWNLSLSTLLDEAAAPVVAGWYDTIYGTHLHWYLDNDSISDGEYWQLLVSVVRRLRGREPEGVLRNTSPEKRVAILLLATGRHADFLAFRNAGGYDLGRFPSRVTAAGLLHELPLTADALASLPDEVLLTPESSMALGQQVLRGGWVGEGAETRLQLAGHAFIPTLDLSVTASHIEVFATNRATGEIAHARVQRSNDSVLHPSRPGDLAEYEGSAYVAEFALASLRGQSVVPAHWDLSIRVSSGPFKVTEPLRNLSSKGGLTETACCVSDGDVRARVASQTNRHVAVRILLEKPAALVDHVALRGRDLAVSFRSTGERRFVRLHLQAAGLPISQVIPVSEQADGSFEVAARISVVDEHDGSVPSAVSWTVRVEDSAGKRVPLSWAEGRKHGPPLGTGTLRAYGSATGNLKLEEYPRGCFFVTGISTAPGELVLSGAAVLPDDCALHSVDGGELMASSTIGSVPDAADIRVALAEVNSARARAVNAFAIAVDACSRHESGHSTRIPVVLGQAALLALPTCVESTAIVAERAKGRTLTLRTTSASGRMRTQ
ncbi:Glycosyltransferase involved in cell wall bisynthesis [Cryobacterium psychrotolerans]|uniref:Glycosyltransferase involved in cell wall bisynthesis n=2 Tax=Cryobacterium psychrotolerans TaxID=386301 RepID=A0A1G9CKU2_9MICO|nr:Glycosyltransferase involved in cell wall bisynthesis [Cryobacterium psychrotolerans]